MTNHALGTFEVQLTPQPLSDAAADPGLGRLAIAKVFGGDLAGSSQGDIAGCFPRCEEQAALDSRGEWKICADSHTSSYHVPPALPAHCICWQHPALGRPRREDSA